VSDFDRGVESAHEVIAVSIRSGDPYYVTATAADDGVYVRDSERLYRLAVTRGDDG
jgi:hypothetical protein